MRLARLFLSPVTAGFPSPADDFQERSVSLDDLLIPHPAATYFARVQGDSMKNLGIRENDIVVVDRALEAQHKSIVLVQLNGGFIVKRLHLHYDATYLFSANAAYRPIKVTQEMDFAVWGVVTACIHIFV